MKKSKSDKGKESRDRIIDVSIRLFMQKGFHGTSLSMVASKAHVTKGGIYHYFSGKEDLYYQSIEAYFKTKLCTAWLEKYADMPVREFVKSRFLDIVENKIRIQQMMGSNKDDAILYLYTFLYEATRKYPEFQKAIDAYDGRKHSAYALIFKKAQTLKQIRPDLNPELLAFELDNYLQQLQYMKFVNPAMSGDDLMLERLFDNYWIRLEH